MQASLVSRPSQDVQTASTSTPSTTYAGNASHSNATSMLMMSSPANVTSTSGSASLHRYHTASDYPRGPIRALPTPKPLSPEPELSRRHTVAPEQHSQQHRSQSIYTIPQGLPRHHSVSINPLDYPTQTGRGPRRLPSLTPRSLPTPPVPPKDEIPPLPIPIPSSRSLSSSEVVVRIDSAAEAKQPQPQPSSSKADTPISPSPTSISSTRSGGSCGSPTSSLSSGARGSPRRRRFTRHQVPPPPNSPPPMPPTDAIIDLSESSTAASEQGSPTRIVRSVNGASHEQELSHNAEQVPSTASPQDSSPITPVLSDHRDSSSPTASARTSVDSTNDHRVAQAEATAPVSTSACIPSLNKGKQKCNCESPATAVAKHLPDEDSDDGDQPYTPKETLLQRHMSMNPSKSQRTFTAMSSTTNSPRRSQSTISPRPASSTSTTRHPLPFSSSRNSTHFIVPPPPPPIPNGVPATNRKSFSQMTTRSVPPPPPPLPSSTPSASTTPHAAPNSASVSSPDRPQHTYQHHLTHDSTSSNHVAQPSPTTSSASSSSAPIEKHVDQEVELGRDTNSSHSTPDGSTYDARPLSIAPASALKIDTKFVRRLSIPPPPPLMPSANPPIEDSCKMSLPSSMGAIDNTDEEIDPHKNENSTSASEQHHISTPQLTDLQESPTSSTDTESTRSSTSPHQLLDSPALQSSEETARSQRTPPAHQEAVANAEWSTRHQSMSSLGSDHGQDQQKRDSQGVPGVDEPARNGALHGLDVVPASASTSPIGALQTQASKALDAESEAPQDPHDVTAMSPPSSGDAQQTSAQASPEKGREWSVDPADDYSSSEDEEPYSPDGTFSAVGSSTQEQSRSSSFAPGDVLPPSPDSPGPSSSASPSLLNGPSPLSALSNPLTDESQDTFPQASESDSTSQRLSSTDGDALPKEIISPIAMYTLNSTIQSDEQRRLAKTDAPAPSDHGLLRAQLPRLSPPDQLQHETQKVLPPTNHTLADKDASASGAPFSVSTGSSQDGSDDDDDLSLTAVTTPIARVSPRRDDGWSFTLGSLSTASLTEKLSASLDQNSSLTSLDSPVTPSALTPVSGPQDSQLSVKSTSDQVSHGPPSPSLSTVSATQMPAPMSRTLSTSSRSSVLPTSSHVASSSSTILARPTFSYAPPSRFANIPPPPPLPSSQPTSSRPPRPMQSTALAHPVPSAFPSQQASSAAGYLQGTTRLRRESTSSTRTTSSSVSSFYLGSDDTLPGSAQVSDLQLPLTDTSDPAIQNASSASRASPMSRERVLSSAQGYIPHKHSPERGSSPESHRSRSPSSPRWSSSRPSTASSDDSDPLRSTSPKGNGPQPNGSTQLPQRPSAAAARRSSLLSQEVDLSMAGPALQVSGSVQALLLAIKSFMDVLDAWSQLVGPSNQAKGVDGVGPEGIKRKVLLKEMEGISAPERTAKLLTGLQIVLKEWSEMEDCFSDCGIDISELGTVQQDLKATMETTIRDLSLSPIRPPESNDFTEKQQKNMKHISAAFVRLFKGILDHRPEWCALLAVLRHPTR